MFVIDLKVDGICNEVITTDYFEIVDGVLHVDGGRTFKITDQTCAQIICDKRK